MSEASYTSPLPTYGDLIEVVEFRESVEDGAFIDYDGEGHPVRNGLMDAAILVKPSRISELPDDATHVMWFNK